MRILGIETSGDRASVALVRDGEVAGERAFPARMTLNQRLAPEIVSLVGEPPLAGELDAVAVGIGPGSFTGVRMGVAVAKAIAHALELPLAGVSAPEAIVARLDAEPGAGVCVLQTARADEVYATTLTVGADGIGEEAEPTRVLTLPRALRTAEELLGRPPQLFAGNAVEQMAEQIPSIFPGAKIANADCAEPLAVDVARFAQRQPERLTSETKFALTPRYVRLSQAERQFGVDLGLR